MIFEQPFSGTLLHHRKAHKIICRAVYQPSGKQFLNQSAQHQSFDNVLQIWVISRLVKPLFR
jgi:hypothetical protein